MSRKVVIHCDGCGEELPREDGARYILTLICMEGPNISSQTEGERQADLCGYCSGLIRTIMTCQENNWSRPLYVELDGAVTSS